MRSYLITLQRKFYVKMIFFGKKKKKIPFFVHVCKLIYFICICSLKTVSLQAHTLEKRKHGNDDRYCLHKKLILYKTDEEEETTTSKRVKKDAEIKKEGRLREERRKIKKEQQKRKKLKRKLEKEKNELLKSKETNSRRVGKKDEEEKKKEEKKNKLGVNDAQNKIKKSSPPFQGLKRTKKRNQRRRILKRSYREAIAAAAAAAAAVNVSDAYTNEDYQTQPNACNTSTVEPTDSQVLPNSFSEEPPQLEDENIAA